MATAAWTSLATVWCLLVLSHGLPSAVGEPSQAEWSCDTLPKVPDAERCSFVAINCSSESVMPYSEWYYCHVVGTGPMLRWLYVALALSLLPLLFCALGDTAELYFSPIMAHVSQSIPKMRPRFAGVTFVALGNGAPDLSSNITAIRSGEVQLSAGALTGAAMFVQCVVAAELIDIGGGVKCAGATTRDVAVYALGVLSVLVTFAIGKVTPFFVGWAITLYVIYIIWVFVGDEWHERGRPQPQLKAPLLALRSALTLRRRQAVPYGASDAWEEAQPTHIPWARADGQETSSHAWEHGGAAGAAATPTFTPTGSGHSGSGVSTELSALHEGRRPALTVRVLPAPPGSPPPPAEPGGALAEEVSSGAGSTPGALLDARHHRQQEREGASQGLQHGLHGPRVEVEEGGGRAFVDARTYQQLVWADLGGDEEEEARLEGLIEEAAHQQQQQQQHLGHSPSGSVEEGGWPAAAAAAVAGGRYSPPASLQAWQPGAGEASDGLAALPGNIAEAALADGAGAAAPGELSGAASHVAEAAAGGGSGGGSASDWLQLWQQLRYEVTLGSCEEWETAGKLRQGFRQVTYPLLLPLYLAQRTTIPFAAAGGGYSREWLAVSLLCCPLALAGYIGVPGVWQLLAAMCAGVAGASGMWCFTSAEPLKPPTLHSGPLASALSGALAVLGFVMGVAWIDTIASEVVGLLTFLASLFGLPSGVLGLTLLAWGNSLGDFFGNRAMARQGRASTAVTACFASPLFNLLMSLALGFGSFFHRTGEAVAEVALTPEVALGCGFLAVYCAAVALTGHLCGQRLPRWFAVFARAWYGLYFLTACAAGLRGAASTGA